MDNRPSFALDSYSEIELAAKATASSAPAPSEPAARKIRPSARSAARAFLDAQLSMFEDDGSVSKMADVGAFCEAVDTLVREASNDSPKASLGEQAIEAAHNEMIGAISLEVVSRKRARTQAAKSRRSTQDIGPCREDGDADVIEAIETEDEADEARLDDEADGDALDDLSDDGREAVVQARSEDSTGDILKLLRTSRFDLLDPAKELELISQAKAGNIDARNELVVRNMRLVVHMCHRFKRPNDNVDDLLSCGVEGFMIAINKLDTEKARLSTYAPFWIRQRIQLHYEQKTGIPRYLRGATNKMEKELETTTDAARAEILKSRIEANRQRLMNAALGTVSMDASASSGSDDEASMHDFQACEEAGPEERAEMMQAITLLRRRIEEIPVDRDREIVELHLGLHPDHLGDPQTLAFIAERFNISRERVRQIYDREAGIVCREMIEFANGEDNLPAGFIDGILKRKPAAKTSP